MLIELVKLAKFIILLLSNQLLCLLAFHRVLESEVEISEEDTDVVVLDLVVLVLRAAFPFEAIVMDVKKLLLTLLHEWQADSCRKVAIREDERGVFKLESHADGTLVPGRVPKSSLDLAGCDIENPCLLRFLRKKQ